MERWIKVLLKEPVNFPTNILSELNPFDSQWHCLLWGLSRDDCDCCSAQPMSGTLHIGRVVYLCVSCHLWLGENLSAIRNPGLCFLNDLHWLDLHPCGKAFLKWKTMACLWRYFNLYAITNVHVNKIEIICLFKNIQLWRTGLKETVQKHNWI